MTLKYISMYKDFPDDDFLVYDPLNTGKINAEEFLSFFAQGISNSTSPIEPLTEPIDPLQFQAPELRGVLYLRVRSAKQLKLSNLWTPIKKDKYLELDMNDISKVLHVKPPYIYPKASSKGSSSSSSTSTSTSSSLLIGGGSNTSNNRLAPTTPTPTSSQGRGYNRMGSLETPSFTGSSSSSSSSDSASPSSNTPSVVQSKRAVNVPPTINETSTSGIKTNKIYIYVYI
jgi:hypothetical protein